MKIKVFISLICISLFIKYSIAQYKSMAGCTNPNSCVDWTPAANQSVNEGDVISFSNNSTGTCCGGDAPNSYNWVFSGGTPGTATGAGPHNITYNTAGTYDVKLTVSYMVSSPCCSFCLPGGQSTCRTRVGQVTVSAVVLPIVLNYFSAVMIDNNNVVDINWSTGMERHNNLFVIERSKDALKWEAVSEIKGVGFSTKEIKYNFKDYEPYSGVSYYRLKNVDFDGQYEYSKIQIVNRNNNIISLTSFLVDQQKDYISFSLKNNNLDLVQVEIINLLGACVYTQKISNLQADIDITNLNRGIYLFRITQLSLSDPKINSIIVQRKFLKEE